MLRVRVGGRTAGSKWFVVSAVVERIEVQLVETAIDFVLDTIVVTVAVCERHYLKERQRGKTWTMARELYFGIKALGCGVLATRRLIRQSAVFIWMLAAVGQNCSA